MARPISMPAKQPYDCHCQPKEKGEHFCWCVSACMHDGGRSWQGKGPRAQQHMLQQSRRHTSTCCSKQEAQQHMLQQAGGTAAQQTGQATGLGLGQECQQIEDTDRCKECRKTDRPRQICAHTQKYASA
eukprot:scaffold4454_cov26-Tisochrysis_lutea.AAC.1